MSKKEVQKEYNKKIKLINNYNDYYYNQSSPIVSDREYDEIKREEHFIKSQTLIDIIDNIERLVRALRKHIIRK